MDASKNTLQKNNFKKGFNLIELIVIVSILTLINMVIFAGYPKFNRRMALKKTSGEIALVVRQAQAYSLANKGFDSGGNYYYPNYGVHFEKNRAYFTLFADTNSSETYAGSIGCGDSECVEFFGLNSANIISSASLCTGSFVCNFYNKVDIVYPRGRTSAFATARGDGGTCSSCSYAKLEISAGGIVPPKYVYIWLNGQISIKDS